MSELTVGSLSGLAANGFVIDVASGSKIVQPGAVLQVVSAVKTDAFTTSSSTFVDVTGLAVTITPSSVSSKILVVANATMGNASTSTDSRYTVVRLVRDSTAIGSSTGGLAAGDGFAAGANLGNSNYPTKAGISHLDSPSTTSATTYKIQVRQNGGSDAHINRNAANTAGGSSDITVMEIAG
jgi:hypothetical protein